MPKRPPATRFLLWALILTAIAPAVSATGEHGNRDLAAVHVGLAEVSFEPRLDVTDWTIIVSGPGSIRFSKSVRGQGPSIALADIEAVAGSLPDGVYAYELVAKPRPSADTDTATGTGTATGTEPIQTALEPLRRQVQFGTFSILDGAIMTPDQLENPAADSPAPGSGRVAPTPAQLITENLAVQGDLCAGSEECLETDLDFFQVIRIKGDNSRLQFRDTSTTTGFPTNDWDLTANGAGNGDPNFFAVTDVDGGNDVLYIEAGAPQYTLYLESDGDVGLGTSNPATTLHVAGSATIDGDLSVLSSAAAKHHIEPLSNQTILRRLEELPIVTWRYLDDPRQARHLGPTAEEFHALFAVGHDGRHLSPIDAAGVALAAAQELQRMLNTQQSEIEEMRRQRDLLAERLQALEEQLAPAGIEEPPPSIGPRLLF